MKKFLTVLLVIAVMFTFSFGSAFAYTDTQKQGVVESEQEAVTKIAEAYNAAANRLAALRDSAKTAASKQETKDAYDVAYEQVLGALDTQRTSALTDLETKMNAITGTIKGYVFDTSTAGSVEPGYVDLAACIAKIDLSLITTIDVWDESTPGFDSTEIAKLEGKVAFDKALAKTKTAIANYDIDKFVKDDKVDHTISGSTVTRSSYEWAVIAQTEALKTLNALVYDGTSVTVTNVTDVYRIEGAGSAGETEKGSLMEGVINVHPGLNKLRTATTLTTDKAKIEYVKSRAAASVKTAIASAKADALKAENDKIFAQSISSKPDQAVINAANEEIARINKEYDALEEVMLYRIENADYKVESDIVKAYYNDEAYNGIIKKQTGPIYSDTNEIAKFQNGVLQAYGLLFPSTMPPGSIGQVALTSLPLTVGAVQAKGEAVNIVDRIAELKDEAEVLKAAVAVDGATALDVDKALENAIDEAYMTGSASLDALKSDTVLHANAHKLLGTQCNVYGVKANAKVTVDGKEYPTVAKWDEPAYSYANADVVDGIIDDAEEAIKAATTVEEANKAFLDAYEKYDAVITIAEQKALFRSKGSLYGKDKAANAELNAYIDFKVSLLNEAPATGTAAAVKTYFNTADVSTMTDQQFKDSYLGEVADEASLQTAIADVKAAVDTLKTKAEMKAESEALVKEANAVKRPVTLEQKDEVLAIYDKVADYEDTCKMVGYTTGKNAVVTSKSGLVADIRRIAGLEKANLDAMKKALGEVNKLTLAQKDAVDAYDDAQTAYNDLYGVDGTYDFADGTDYDGADAYTAKIWALRLNEVRKLIAVLPTYPTTAQVLEAKTALDDLGFKGICDIGDSYLTKLDKFTQDANESSIANVKTLKITASSSVKKGSITVKWTVKGDATGVEGYEIWKSTKHSKGYKKAFTTTKKSYKNTKGLKKDTRYYYKVRAYANIDGKKVTSDWSNKARRIAK